MAPAMGLKVGDVVVMNLIYQIEHIGITCNASNNTGPVPNCPPSKNHTPGLDAPGLCTSVMSMSGGGDMYHGRNLDWNIPAALRPLMVDVDYTRNGSVLFTASQPVGFSGIMHGVRHDGWSFSLNARDKGGKVLVNLVQALLRKSVTPTQHARMAMEAQATFDGAVTVGPAGCGRRCRRASGRAGGRAGLLRRGVDGGCGGRGRPGHTPGRAWLCAMRRCGHPVCGGCPQRLSGKWDAAGGVGGGAAVAQNTVTRLAWPRGAGRRRG